MRRRRLSHPHSSSSCKSPGALFCCKIRRRKENRRGGKLLPHFPEGRIPHSTSETPPSSLPPPATATRIWCSDYVAASFRHPERGGGEGGGGAPLYEIEASEGIKPKEGWEKGAPTLFMGPFCHNTALPPTQHYRRGPLSHLS